MLSPGYLNQQSSNKALRQFLYTPIEEAVNTIDSRQKQHLQLFNIDTPAPLHTHLEWGNTSQPRTAIMFRQIATPNYEMQRVVELCGKHKLNLLILSFEEDKFCSHNACKYALGRMGFFNGYGRQGGKKISYSTIINFNQYDSCILRECKTFRGESLVKFHHKLLFQEFLQLSSDNIFDNSKWFIKQSTNKSNLYLEFLKLFLKNAILFETFVLSGRELDFTMMKVLPAFQEIINTYGIKPLIVNSEDPDMEGDNYWQLYPDHLHAFAPFDRRKTPRYEAPFDNFTPAIINHKKWTTGSK